MSLQLKHIKKSFQQECVFDDVSLTIDKSGLYFLYGASGCGKSTLLNIIAGYEAIDEGERIADEVHIAYIFQNFELINELNVEENIFLSCDLFQRAHTHRQEEIIQQLKIDELLNYYPNELSQGQRQRIGIARVLMEDPDIILCDEPTESLDIDNKIQVMELLKQLSKEKAVVIASHDENLLKEYADVRWEIAKRTIILHDEDDYNSVSLQHHPQQHYQPSPLLKSYIKRLGGKRYIVSAICICLITLLWGVLLRTYGTMFPKVPYETVLNQDVLYVTNYSYDKEKWQILCKDELNHPYVRFSPVAINGREYKINVFPLPENSGIELKEHEIAINQLTKNQLTHLLGVSEEELIGQSLSLTYELEFAYKKQFVIKEIVEETALQDTMQIYYDETAFLAYLKQAGGKFMDTQFEEYGYMDANYIMENTKANRDKQEQLKGVAVYNPVLDEQKNSVNNNSVFKFMFITLFGAIAVVETFFMIFYIGKLIEKDKAALVIFHTVGVPIEQIKKAYMREKITYTIAGSVLAGGLGCILLLTQQIQYIAIFLLYVCFIMNVYLFTIKKTLKKMDVANISFILKEDKDK